MPLTVTMPKLSPTMETGVIAKWHKKEGDKVNPGDVLLEITTDKATVEHSSIDEGYLRKILVQEGQDAQVNQPIAILTEDEKESIEGYQPEGVATAAPAPKEAKVETAKVQAQIKPSERIVASPLAKKLAKDKGIDLSKISGSGPRGRIVAKDLEKGPTRVAAESGTFEEVTLTPMRKVISTRLKEAKTTIPHFYVTQTVDAEPLMNLRLQLEALNNKVSVNDCIIKAVALALREHPLVNSGFDPDKQTILQYKTIDISVAVNLENGLITPIVKNADHKSLPEISQEIKNLVAKAKAGKLAPNEFQGGSFTVSNLGMFKVTEFKAIINPPQVAILAVGGIEDVPVVKDGQVVPGKVMHLTLSADHRVVDGVLGAQFIKTLQQKLENPISLLL